MLFVIFRQPDIDLEVLKKKYADTESRFLNLNDVQVHYRVEGQGDTLLLIHGTASSLHTWDGWVKELSDSLTIVRLDLPAFGLTGPRPDRDYSIKAYSKFINDFTDKLNLNHFVIAGNSLGGNIAWKFTIDHPEKVKGLILIDSGGFPKSGSSLATKLARNWITAPILKEITPRSFLEKNIKDVYFNDDLITKALVDRYYELNLREGNRQAFIDRARANFVDHTPELIQIKVPTLIQWGTYDEWIFVENSSKFDSLIPNSKVILYEAGHVPMEELPERTSEDVFQFLKETSTHN